MKRVFCWNKKNFLCVFLCLANQKRVRIRDGRSEEGEAVILLFTITRYIAYIPNTAGSLI